MSSIPQIQRTSDGLIHSEGKSFVTPLRSLREGRRLTLRELSNVTGIDCGTLSRIERGGTTSPTTARRLAEVFRGEVNELQILYPEDYLIYPEATAT